MRNSVGFRSSAEFGVDTYVKCFAFGGGERLEEVSPAGGMFFLLLDFYPVPRGMLGAPAFRRLSCNHEL